MLAFLLRPTILVSFLLISIFLGACTKGQEVNAVSQDEFASELEKRLFAEDPFSTDHLAEMRTSNTSWDISTIILDITGRSESDIRAEDLTSMGLSLSSRHSRDDITDDLSAKERRRIEDNLRYPDVDRVWFYSGNFPLTFMEYQGEMHAISGYEVLISLVEKLGTGKQRVKYAKLFFHSL